MPQLVEKPATFALRSTGDTRIAVVSDTHSRPHPGLALQLAALRPDAILHAGDIGGAAVSDDLARIAPLFAVRGNVDPRGPELPDVVIMELTGRDHSLRLMLVHIAQYGPKLRADIGRRARIHGASLVVCGHSHVPFIGRDRDLTIFNPGSSGPRRFHLPIVFGTIDISSTGVRLAHVDCETGQRWTPP